MRSIVSSLFSPCFFGLLIISTSNAPVIASGLETPLARARSLCDAAFSAPVSTDLPKPPVIIMINKEKNENDFLDKQIGARGKYILNQSERQEGLVKISKWQT